MFLMFFYLVIGFGIKKIRKRGENGQKFAFLQISEFAAANWMFAPANVFAPAKSKSAPADPCMHSSIQIPGTMPSPRTILFAPANSLFAAADWSATNLRDFPGFFQLSFHFSPY